MSDKLSDGTTDWHNWMRDTMQINPKDTRTIEIVWACISRCQSDFEKKFCSVCAKNTEHPTIEEDPTMSDYTQPPEPVEPKYIRQDRRPSKSMIVWIDKDEATNLYACRAALIDCLDQMARTPKSAVSPDFIAAIDDGRKALGES